MAYFQEGLGVFDKKKYCVLQINVVLLQPTLRKIVANCC